MAIKKQYNDLVDSIKELYEKLAYTMTQYVVNSRNTLSDGKYSKFTPANQKELDSDISKTVGYISIRTKMITLEEIIDDNNLSIAKWRWPNL